MRIEKVVVNSSPLIVLFRSGQANLLPQLFREIVVPEQVYAEVLAGGANDEQRSCSPRQTGLSGKKWRLPSLLRLGIWETENPRYFLMLLEHPDSEHSWTISQHADVLVPLEFRQWAPGDLWCLPNDGD